MHATSAQPRSPFALTARNLGWFLVTPVTVVVLVAILAAFILTSYRQEHDGRIFTGVMLAGRDLGGLTKSEALQALQGLFTYPDEEAITLIDPLTGERWQRRPADLGLRFDLSATVDAAYDVGRRGDVLARTNNLFRTWYFGQPVAPIIVFDEGQFEQALTAIAAEIDQPTADASLYWDGTNVDFTNAQVGRTLDVADTRARLVEAISRLQPAEVELLIHETAPNVVDTSVAAEAIGNIMSGPMTFYLQEPLDGRDLQPVVLPAEQLVHWIRVQPITNEQGQLTNEVFLDENAFRAWLAPYEDELRRAPENARFYFDDNTRELVLVEPHVNGRALDVEATVARFMDQVRTTDRQMPFVVADVVPAVHSGASAQDLSITELVSESTTWFFGSSDERKHNIARAASNYYGIVIAPGQEFSFNQFLGDVSLDEGYEQGLIIFGGRTIEGVGGGVCQVSTTVFQAAFWAGYPIVERWEHGYQVGYYDDGEGPGMDATVYSPLVDFRFINDTPHYLLIENYYSEANSSLTFKFYSTSMGRTVVKEGPVIRNVVPAKPDVWELNEELEAGQIEQVDWAVDGADVTVVRSVYNFNNELLRQDTFTSHYIPWQNVYQYGPGTELPTPTPTAAPAEATPEATPTGEATPAD